MEVDALQASGPTGARAQSKVHFTHDTKQGNSPQGKRLLQKHPSQGTPNVPNGTCAAPDYNELIRSVSTVLHRRIGENELHGNKSDMPIFCEDTHTSQPHPDRYELQNSTWLPRPLVGPTVFAIKKLPAMPATPKQFPIPDVDTIFSFIQGIWRRARLAEHCIIASLVYIDRLEAKAMGALLHARTWRPTVFCSLLLASKVWHDVSYWNSDFSTICPMFKTQNINRLERQYLNLLEYNTIISSQLYAQYYFALRQQNQQAKQSSSKQKDFRSKYLMAINVPGGKRVEQQPREREMPTTSL